MTNILVTGSNGQLGQEFQRIASNHKDFNFIFTNRTNLDITNEEAVKTFFKENKIDFCINCAAYTAVDNAEKERDAAYQVNKYAVQYLTEAAKSSKSWLVHVSSDYVYHNTDNFPLTEDAETTPKGVYAASKLAGEEVALTYKRSIVLRTSWVYSSFGKNFVKTMLALSQKYDKLRVIYDQIGTPTYARDIATTILQIINTIHEEKAAIDYSGIFNFSNEGVTTWYDFAKAIFEIRGIEIPVTPIETKDYPTPAARPSYSVLNKEKIKLTFDMEIPYWRDALKRCMDLIE